MQISPFRSPFTCCKLCKWNCQSLLVAWFSYAVCIIHAVIMRRGTFNIGKQWKDTCCIFHDMKYVSLHGFTKPVAMYCSCCSSDNIIVTETLNNIPVAHELVDHPDYQILFRGPIRLVWLIDIWKGSISSFCCHQLPWIPIQIPQLSFLHIHLFVHTGVSPCTYYLIHHSSFRPASQ